LDEDAPLARRRVYGEDREHVRAANVLHNLGIDDAKGPLVCLSELNHVAAVNCMAPDLFLQRQRNAGPVTRREILGWCGLATEPALHVCTCRTCGRTFGKRYNPEKAHGSSAGRRQDAGPVREVRRRP
jgi:hypothetical protein